MQFVNLPDSAKVNNYPDYQPWLESLSDGDEVLIQSFHPASDGALDHPVEYWQYEFATVHGSRLWGDTNRPFKPGTGKLCYWNSDDDWGEVFPARIVPTSPYIPAERHRPIFSMMPVYEPLFSGAARLVILAGRSVLGLRGLMPRVFPHSYSIEVREGFLYHCFHEDDGTGEIDAKVKAVTEKGAKPLYSEYLRRF